MTYEEFLEKVIRLARRECTPEEAGMIALELLAEYRRLAGAIGTEREAGR
ncbi:MAG: hypothetical protein KJ042_05645 [Deltaproteobacteria bacterium]|nr:hypothetical protein [Deltaproteobacteria bacterium]